MSEYIKELQRHARRRRQILAMLSRGKRQIDVAKHFGITRQRVAQIAAEARK
jgi:DNA-binding CsgD family transcriptional regulator